MIVNEAVPAPSVLRTGVTRAAAEAMHRELERHQDQVTEYAKLMHGGPPSMQDAIQVQRLLTRFSIALGHHEDTEDTYHELRGALSFFLRHAKRDPTILRSNPANAAVILTYASLVRQAKAAFPNRNDWRHVRGIFMQSPSTESMSETVDQTESVTNKPSTAVQADMDLDDVSEHPPEQQPVQPEQEGPIKQPQQQGPARQPEQGPSQPTQPNNELLAAMEERLNRLQEQLQRATQVGRADHKGLLKANKPDSFSGTDKHRGHYALTWLQRTEQILEQTHTPDADKVGHVATYLTGAAFAWYLSNVKDTLYDAALGYVPWQAFAAAFQQYYVGTEDSNAARAELRSIYQGKHSAELYSTQFRQVIARITVGPKHDAATQAAHYIKASTMMYSLYLLQEQLVKRC